MAKKCAICGKTSSMGRSYKKLMSKYNPTPMKRKYPNLQWTRIPADTKNKSYREFLGQRIVACAKCIKTLSKPEK